MKEGLAHLVKLVEMVVTHGTSILEGNSLRGDIIIPELEQAARMGWVSHDHVDYLRDGLRFGFMAGVDLDSPHLKGRRCFRNYSTSTDNRGAVSAGLRERVDLGKSLCLGEYSHQRDRKLLDDLWDTWRIFPMGGTPKPLEPGVYRGTSDHSRTGLNLATNLEWLRHSITVYRDIEAHHHSGAVMRVSDVTGAFPLLPWHHSVWRHLLFQWWDLDYPDSDTSAPMCLYVNLFGDFGASGMPGCWHMLFEKGLIPTARSLGILTRPMPVCVDDTAIIGPCGDNMGTDAEGAAFTEWLAARGVFSKVLKVKAAASLQLCVGFWWDSLTHTRTLEERKLCAYVEMLSGLAKRRSVSLREMQQAGGRMQRGIMTLPPGASCLLANLFALMRGLSLPWQRRRTSAALRADLQTVADLLELNQGRGYYRFDSFGLAPMVDTDASKSPTYSGGGYFSRCGRFRYWRYGNQASRQPIDYLEGDTVTVAVADLAHLWHHKRVPMRVDNRAFQASAVKGWSKAERLSLLIRRLFEYSLRFEFILEFEWVASDDNIYADPLSREHGLTKFFKLVHELQPLPIGVRLQRHPSSGAVRRFGRAFSSDEDGDGPRGKLPRGAGLWWLCLGLVLGNTEGARGGKHAHGGGVSSTLSYSRTSVFTGLPEGLAQQVDELLDNRLSASSLRSMNAVLTHWDLVRDRFGWERVLRSDSVERGCRLVTLLLYFIHETDLVADSISNYFWALRAWNKLQRQLDPVYGVAEWDDLMASTAVVAWVASEPRRRVPIELIADALGNVDNTVFWEVQAAVLMLLLLYTFARAETPLPQAYTGEGAFDRLRHLQVRDVRVVNDPSVHVKVRLKIVKQDQRMERTASCSTEGDWIVVGSADDSSLDMLWWLREYYRLLGGPRPSDSPFFEREPHSGTPLLYRHALQQLRALWARVSSPEEASKLGLHGLRVEGYNKTARHDRMLAVVQGGWEPDARANERYDRVQLSAALNIPNMIVSTLHDDAPAGAAELGEASSSSQPAAPRAQDGPIERALPHDGGGRLGSARRGQGRAQHAVVASPSQASAAIVTSSSPACVSASLSNAPVHGSTMLVTASEGASTRGKRDAVGRLRNRPPSRAARWQPPQHSRIRVYSATEQAYFTGLVMSHRGQLTRVLYDATSSASACSQWLNLRIEQWQSI